MEPFDLAGLSVALAIGALLVALGAGIDSLLLERHADRLKLVSLNWYVFFDNLRLRDATPAAIRLILAVKDLLLGPRITKRVLVRAFLISVLLSIITISGGRALGYYLMGKCLDSNFFDLPLVSQYGDAISVAMRVGWNWTGWRMTLPAAIVSFVADFSTIIVTAALLQQAANRPLPVALALVLGNILFCVTLAYNALYLQDLLDPANSIFGDSYWGLFTLFPLQVEVAGCIGYFVYTPRLLFVSAVLLPTLSLLAAIAFLLVFKVSFDLSRFLMLHLLEKSVEDKKTMFAHFGTFLGLLVAGGKAAAEVFKALGIGT